MKAGTAAREVEIAGILKTVPGRQGRVDVGQVVVRGEVNGLRLGHVGVLQRLLEARVALDDRDPEIQDLVDEMAFALALDRHRVEPEGGQLLENPVADLADPDHDVVVAHRRGFHDLPLLKLLFPGENKVAQPDDGVRDRPQADHGDHEKKRPEESLHGKLQLRLHEDEKEDVVARLNVIGLLRRVGEVDEESPAEHDGEENAHRPPELAGQETGVAPEYSEPAAASHERIRPPS